jgi:hypothetical protein
VIPPAGEVTEHGMIGVFQVERQNTAFPNKTNTGPQKKRTPDKLQEISEEDLQQKVNRLGAPPRAEVPHGYRCS